MGCDYRGPPAPAPEPDVTPLAAPSEKTSSCQDSCCDSDDAEPLDTTASGHKEPIPEKSDDCCSSGKCADNKSKNHTDAPDCCRGKVSPCCDTSCLDRLAMRECDMSATAGPGPNNQPNGEYPLFENGIQRFLTPFSLRWTYRP
jgi:Cu2+-exporting ATPase